MTALSESDPYVVLGVAADADLQTIKKAYRRLAMRLHPDRNPDPAAHEAFKRLQAAYAELVDIAGAGQETAAPTDRGNDRWQDLELGLEEAFAGCEKTVPVLSEAACERCDGSGRVELAHSRLCECCVGSGRVRAGKGLESCAVCEGRGYTRRGNCPDCGGLGSLRQTREFAVKVPPGMLEGDELRLEGRGYAAENAGAAAGDLRLRICLRPHPLYRLKGRDLHLDRPLSAFVLLGGGDVLLPSPSGVRKVQLPPGPCIPTDRKSVV